MKPFRVYRAVSLFALSTFAACAAPVASPFGINGAGWSHLGANTPEFDFAAGQKRLDSLAKMGAAWDRCDFWWHRIEPQTGKFVWSDYDRAVDAYEKAGVHVLPILCYDAAWHPNQSPNTPEYREEYGRFVYETVKHFKGRISAYEIWNEPNGAQYWRVKPSADDYTALLKVAYREAKRADSSVTVVGGAIAGMDWPFIGDAESRRGRLHGRNQRPPIPRQSGQRGA
jgi:polysaccharide biosynthesis protein PslG